jgi:anti-anti-sigma regulatory factor
VVGLAREWGESLAAGSAAAPDIDLSAVTELDGAGLQLLVAARRAGARLHAPSPAVRAAADRFGLGHLIEPAGAMS